MTLSEHIDEPTLLDAFAIAALPAIVADGLRNDVSPKEIAAKAYEIAAAMLRRRQES